jgi:hypothetical protein
MIKLICIFKTNNINLTKAPNCIKKIISGYQKQSMGVFGLGVKKPLWFMSCEKDKYRLVRNCYKYSKKVKFKIEMQI